MFVWITRRRALRLERRRTFIFSVSQAKSQREEASASLPQPFGVSAAPSAATFTLKTVWPPLSSSLSPACAVPLTWMGIILSSHRSHSAWPFTSSGWADNIHLITPCGSAVEAGVGRLTVHSAPAEESRALCCLSQRHAVLFSLWLLLLLQSAATPAFALALFFPFLPYKYFDFISFLLNEYNFSPLCPILLL